MSRDLTRWLLITLMVLPVITACASRTQSNYYRDEIGEIMAVEDVWIISSRMVRIDKPAGNKVAIVQAVESAEEMLPARTPALLIRGKSGYYRIIPQ